MELRSTSAPTSSSTLANSRARSGSGVHYRHRRRWLVQLFLADGVQLQCAWTSRENLQRTPPDITICLEKWCSRVTSRSATGLWPQSAMRRSLLKPQTHRQPTSSCGVRAPRSLALHCRVSGRRSFVALGKRFCAVSNSRILSETSDIFDLIRVN